MNFDMQEYLVKFASDVVQNIGIRLSVRDLRRWKGAVKNIQTRARYWIEDEMQRRCAIELSQMQIANIMSGKQFGTYPAYSERYERWKAQYFPGRPFWFLRGDLVKNIRPFSFSKGGTGKDWMAGVPSGAYDSGGKSWLGEGDKGRSKSIAMYGKKAEELRPMFEPTQDQYAEHDWQEKGREALEEIGGGWR